MAEPRSHPELRPSGFRRLLAWPNVTAVAIGLVVFAGALRLDDSNRGAVIAAAAGGSAAALIWLIWNRLAGLRPVSALVDLPRVGAIPATPRTPSPTLTAPDSSAAVAYQRAAGRLEASTRGRVLLVAGLQPGQGASTAALNLAVAATRAGRRTLLIDGDVRGTGLSSFGRTGSAPGLLDLAHRRATLAEASRMWTIDRANRLPFIPVGSNDGTHIDRAALADAVEDVTTAADLVFIDAPIDANGSLEALGTLADGSLLVLPGAADRTRLQALQDRLSVVGAPPVGYLINEAAPSPASLYQHPVLRSLKRALATALLILLGYSIWNGVQIWDSWRNVERQGLDVAAANELLPLPAEGVADSEGLGAEVASAVTAVPAEEGVYLSVLIVGTDLSGSLADVIMLAVIPVDGSDPVIVSLPRDLYLPNRCTQTYTRINANLAGCGDTVNGPTLLALAVEDFTGIQVDHFVLFTFEGFERVIDRVGGVEICVDNPVRDARSELDLPAGCTQATGAQALAWVRSRRTQELVDGRWRTMPGVNDLTRNQRQQDVILQMIAKLRDFSSPAALTATVRSVSDAFTLDDRLGVTDAISLAWNLRDVDPATVVGLEIPVADQQTSSGAQVLVPVVSFDQVLAEVYPDLAPTLEN